MLRGQKSPESGLFAYKYALIPYTDFWNSMNWLLTQEGNLCESQIRILLT